MSLRIRELSGTAELDGAYQLFDSIWRPEPGNQPVTADLLRAMSKAGTYIAGAFAGERLVGACVGFCGPPRDLVMHSHIAGVAPGSRGAGYALKQHQRTWALQRGVTAIVWTFDPHVARNAYFNLAKLGADPVEYLPNFYGSMNDAINGSDETDRLLVRWDLTAPHVGTGTPRLADAGGAVTGLGRSPDGLPLVQDCAGDAGLVAVPQDIETLRTTDPGAAKAWRLAVRDVLAPLMASGARVTGFDRSGWYVVRRSAS